MAAEKAWTGDDPRHNAQCHQSWEPRRHRDTADPTYPDQWYLEQCGGCRYWITLAGNIGNDYGACTNAASPFDATVRFEHDGCDARADRSDGSWG